MGSGGAGGGGGPHGGGWRGICATSTLARLDALNCWMAACFFFLLHSRASDQALSVIEV